MANEYTPAPPDGGSDDNRCMVLDPGATGPVFLTGVQFEPDGPSIVHHAVTFAVDNQALHELREPVTLEVDDMLRTTSVSASN